jgi:hypothetical protein
MIRVMVERIQGDELMQVQDGAGTYAEENA